METGAGGREHAEKAGAGGGVRRGGGVEAGDGRWGTEACGGVKVGRRRAKVGGGGRMRAESDVGKRRQADACGGRR